MILLILTIVFKKARSAGNLSDKAFVLGGAGGVKYIIIGSVLHATTCHGNF